MTDKQYIRQCLLDAISALDIDYSMPSTEPIKINNGYIYPQIAISRIKNALSKLVGV